MTSPKNRTIMIDARYLDGHSSGIGRYTQYLIEELLNLDSTLQLRLITAANNPRPVDHPRVTCQVFRAEANSLRTRFALTRAIDFTGVDLFHSPFNILPANLPVPAVFTLHDIMWLLDVNYCTDSRWRKIVTGTFYQQFIPRSVAQASRIFTVSEYSKTEIENYFPATKGRVDVTYNGLDPFFHPVSPEEGWPILQKFQKQLPPNSRFVLVVGQGSPYKNHAGALAGFLEAFRNRKDIYFVLVRRLSRGPADRLHRLMQDPDLKGRVIQLEHIDAHELRALYSLATVFLFPSLYEGFGLPALEAMACGTPVITSNIGAPAEIGAPAAVLVDPHDEPAIGRALTHLFDDPAHYAERREAGFQRARDFQWRHTAQAVLAGYNKILNTPPRHQQNTGAR